MEEVHEMLMNLTPTVVSDMMKVSREGHQIRPWCL